MWGSLTWRYHLSMKLCSQDPACANTAHSGVWRSDLEMPRSTLGFLRKITWRCFVPNNIFGGFNWKEVGTASGFKHDDLARDAKRHEHESTVKILKHVKTLKHVEKVNQNQQHQFSPGTTTKNSVAILWPWGHEILLLLTQSIDTRGFFIVYNITGDNGDVEWTRFHTNLL